MSETNGRDPLDDLLRAERERDELPDADLDEAWRALDAKIGALSPVLPPITTTPPSPWTAVAKVVGAVAIFGAGVWTGTLLERRHAPETPALVSPAPSVSSASPPPSAEVVPPVVASAPSVPSAAAAPIVHARPSSAPTPSGSASASAPAPAIGSPDLADERSLVEGARVALLRGRPFDALALAESHEKRFPGGELAEDRDFLRIRALRDAGKKEEATARAKAFLARYPKSGLRGVVAPIAE